MPGSRAGGKLRPRWNKITSRQRGTNLAKAPEAGRRCLVANGSRLAASPADPPTFLFSSSALRSTKRVCGMGPSTLSTSSRTPSAMLSTLRSKTMGGRTL